MHRLISVARRAIPLAGLALFLLVSPFAKVGYSRALPRNAVGDTTRRIVEGRELVNGYAADLKEKDKSSTPEYRVARKRYGVALSKYNAGAVPVKKEKKPKTPPQQTGVVEEIQMGDPPQAGVTFDPGKGGPEQLIVDEETAKLIDENVNGESKAAKVDSKTLALATLNLAKQYAGMHVSRAEPPAPTPVKSFLKLYGLPFSYGGSSFVPYCAAGVGFTAARAHRRLSWPVDHPTDPVNADSEDPIALRDSLPDVTRDFAKTHPSTIFMMNAAKERKYPNGQSYWVPRGQRPQQGWLVLFNWKGGKMSQHIAIVDSFNAAANKVNTLEFNTSDTNPSNGGKVVAKTRPVRFVVGYIRTYQ